VCVCVCNNGAVKEMGWSLILICVRCNVVDRIHASSDVIVMADFIQPLALVNLFVGLVVTRCCVFCLVKLALLAQRVVLPL
jgi:hypothetical protein